MPSGPTVQELVGRILGNSLWILTSSAGVRGLNLSKSLILAWLLAPDDFGVFGIAMVVTGLALMLGDMGAGVFLIYDKDAELHASSAFWFNLAIGGLLGALVNLAAPIVARVYQRPELIGMLAILSVSVCLEVTASVPRNLLGRRLRFRAMALVDLAANLALFLVAVGLAWGGAGVWSFAWSTLVGQAITLALLHSAAGWMPRSGPAVASLRAIGSFSGWYVMASFVWYLALSLDKILIGKYLAVSALGVYSLASMYAMLPVSLVATPLGQVVLPEFARLHDDPVGFWAFFDRISKLLVGAVAPLAFTLIVVAPQLFELVLAPKWRDGVFPFQALLAYTVLRCLWLNPFSALGRFDLALWHGAGTCVVTAIAMWFSLDYGINGVAVVVLVCIGLSHVTALFVASRSVRRVAAVLAVVTPHLLGAGIPAAVTWLLLDLVGDAALGRGGAIVVASLLILGTYAVIFRHWLRELCRVFRPGIPAGEPLAVKE